MHDYTLTHLSDAALLCNLAALVARDRVTTAELLAHFAEVDARRLYVSEGYSSMHAFCMDELRLSEDAASKRIQAARACRQFPALFTALAEGRLHLAAVCLLAPHLSPGDVDELIEAATHRSKSEIERLLAQQFPLPDWRSARVYPMATTTSVLPNPGHAETGISPSVATTDEHAPGHAQSLQAQVPQPLHSSDAFFVQVAIAKSTYDKLRHAQDLLSHSVPSGDVAQVLDRALDALISQLEKRKFGATARRLRHVVRVHGDQTTSVGKRYVPAHVRRAVWERDKGRCTFVSASGTRCKARRFLEFDHIDPVARGGKATVDRMRLRCRAHNQYEAEQAFGSRFMKRKRDEARAAMAERAAKEPSRDVLAGLRNLGCKADEARQAAEFAETLQGATFEDRVRAALRFLSPGPRSAVGRMDS